ncbi:uncharacterized protein PAC_07166 [Phialocephala subalpina]|uniref:Uncharacterized protein n=1 Tax=Phialocephala subalpina TaxID=576137 RepID=A0A1L7WWX8_9HELO|nr:uncharacterized protein PAC_07166 [Phialocephala subalpina]
MSRSSAYHVSNQSEIQSFHGSKEEASEKSSKKSIRGADRGGKKSGPFRKAVVILSFLIQGGCVVSVSQYDFSHMGLVRHPLPRSICFPSLTSSCSISWALPEAILDPSSALFANSVMIFGIAVFTSYGLQKDNGFRDHILGFGAVLGFLMSAVIAGIEGGVGTIIKDYMPAFITLSLLASTCVDGMIRGI